MRKALFRIGSRKINVYIPESFQEHVDGLQPFEKLDSGYGMLFHYEPPSPRKFHMGSVKFPIDIAFFDDKGNIARIVKNIKPGCKDIWGIDCCNAVLEVPGGYFDRMGIAEGIYDYEVEPDNDFQYNPFSLDPYGDEKEADALSDSLHGGTPTDLFESIHTSFDRITPLRIESPAGDWSHMDVRNVFNPKNVEWYPRTAQLAETPEEAAKLLTTIVKLIDDMGAPEWTSTEEIEKDGMPVRQRFARINRHKIRYYATRAKSIDASDLDWINLFWADKSNVVNLADAILEAGMADGYKIEDDTIILYEWFQ